MASLRACFAACVLCALAVGGAQTGLTGFCDPALEASPGDANRYQERNQNRCEGLYLQDVASSVIKLTSLTAAYDDFSAGETLKLGWSQVALQPDDPFLRVRAESHVFKLYYRMDTRVAVGDGRFVWPTDLLADLGMDSGDVGLSAWLPVTLGEVERDVYIPLSVTQDGSLEGGGYQVTVVPSAELSEVKYYVAAEDGGYRGKPVIPEQVLRYGYYPNGRPVAFGFDLGGREAGVYYLEVEAEREGDSDSRLELWFYHAGG